jgi:hypothetical protein
MKKLDKKERKRGLPLFLRRNSLFILYNKL